MNEQLQKLFAAIAKKEEARQQNDILEKQITTQQETIDRLVSQLAGREIPIVVATPMGSYYVIYDSRHDGPCMAKVEVQQL